MGVQASRNRWLSLVFIVETTYSYIDGRRLVIWLKDTVDIWRYVMTVNGVNILKSGTMSLWEGRFCDC